MYKYNNLLRPLVYRFKLVFYNAIRFVKSAYKFYIWMSVEIELKLSTIYRSLQFNLVPFVFTVRKYGLSSRYNTLLYSHSARSRID